ncbi:unnamed protein product [Auanema sp. JU1783]|nr:unnamed protein product [Auanema sp. JU1783]
MYCLITLLFILSVCPAATSLNCHQPRDQGYECAENAKSIRFYYDTRRGVCQPMAYKGCGGNENKFESAVQCRDDCQMKPRERANSSQIRDDTLIVNACELDTDAKISEKVKSCGSGCPDGYECNENKHCCPTRSFICRLPVTSGHEAVSLKHYGRFAYMPGLENCLRFSYFGAEGNYNNFKTYNDCKKFCMDGM